MAATTRQQQRAAIPKFGRKSSLERLWFVILSVFVIGYAFLAGVRALTEFDLGWLLATGRWIAQHRQIPSTDVFSYTAQGQPWIYPIKPHFLRCLVGRGLCAALVARGSGLRSDDRFAVAARIDDFRCAGHHGRSFDCHPHASARRHVHRGAVCSLSRPAVELPSNWPNPAVAAAAIDGGGGHSPSPLCR